MLMLEASWSAMRGNFELNCQDKVKSSLNGLMRK